MQKISVLVFPYRDEYFVGRYGCAVRDLHLIKALDGLECINKIVVVNRPVSVYERFLGKRSAGHAKEFNKVSFFDVTSFSILGPLSGRTWTIDCYGRYLDDIRAFFEDGLDPDDRKVLIDFTPVSKINLHGFDGYFKWYDLIDSFHKHNRYNERQKKAALDKYKSLGGFDLVTAVSDGALSSVTSFHGRKMVLPNGLVSRAGSISWSGDYDFGFVGFVTDKFDVGFLKGIKERIPGARIAVYGKYYSSAVRREISKYADCYGEFHDSDVARIMSSFRIGLVPYIKSKSHDESPLKIYQYISYGRAVVSTIKYEYVSPWVVSSESGLFDVALADFCDSVLCRDDESVSGEISKTIGDDCFWDAKVLKVLDGVPN